MEEGFLYSKGHVFIRKCAAQRNYVGAPGDTHLKDTWQACNTLVVVPCSHACLDCRVVVPASPGLMFVSISSADKDAAKTFDSFNRMHMIWIDRFEMGA